MTKRSTRLPADVAELLRRHQGVITRNDAIEAKLYDARLRHVARDGGLVRVARGGYVSADALATADSWGAVSLRGRAFVLSQPGCFLAGHAAAALLGLRTLGDAEPLPTVVTDVGTRVRGRRTAYGTIRSAALSKQHLRIAGKRFRVMSPAWTTVDLARGGPLDVSLAMADGVVREHHRLTGHPAADPRLIRSHDLHDALESMSGWPSWGRASWVIDHADPGAETVLETCGRFAFIAAGLPPSVSNAHIQLPDGRWRRVDHLWPWHYVVAEADGAIKYNNRPDASMIIADEKEREWELRSLDLAMVRYTWRLARHDRSELVGRVRGLLATNPPRQDPFPWWKDVPGVGRVLAKPEDQPTPLPRALVLPPGVRR